MTQLQALELLKQARNRFTQREIASQIGKDAKTVRRWEKGFGRNQSETRLTR